MMLNQFFSTVLPQKSQAEFYHLFVPGLGNIHAVSIEDLVYKVKHLEILQDKDCYFSLYSSSDINSRKAEYLISGQTLALDIDIKGEDSHKDENNYRSTKQALVALSKINLAPTYVVMTGSGGLHVYFALNETISASDCHDLTLRLAIYTQEHGLYVDRQALSTTQVLRVPETLHTKTGNKIKILTGPDIIYSPTELDSLLPALNDIVIESAFNKVPLTASQKMITLKDMPNFEPISEPDIYPEINAFNVIFRCKQILHMGDNVYKNWFGAMSVLGHFQNGYEMAKQLSKQTTTDRYDEQVFEKQWDNIILDRPFTCDSFKANNPSLCEDCQCFKLSKIRSPIALRNQQSLKLVLSEVRDKYRKIFPNYLDTDNLQDTLDEVDFVSYTDSNTFLNLLINGFKYKAMPIPSPLDLSYSYDTTKYETIYTEVVIDKKSGQQKIIHHVIANAIVEFLYAKDVKDKYLPPCTRYFFRLTFSATSKTEIAFDDLNNIGTFTSLCSANGLLVKQRTASRLLDFMQSYVVKVLQNNPERRLSESQHYGWLDDNSGRLGYLTDDGLITAQGLEPYSVRGFKKVGDLEKKYFFAKGSFNLWQKAIDVYKVLDQKLSQLIVCFSFASCLISKVLPDINTAIVNMYGYSGIGKSTIMHAAISVWGDPLAIKIKGSSLAIQKTLNVWRNMPCSIEELLVTIPDPMQLGSMVFQLIDGEEKIRLTQKAEFQSSGIWSNIMLSAANRPLHEALTAYTNDNNAAQMRVIDIEAPNYRYKADSPDLKVIKEGMDLMRENFGLAGPLFVQWCLKNWHEVTNLKMRIDGLLQKYNCISNHRYLTQPLALAVLTCELLNRSGILNWDYKSLEQFAFKEILPVVINSVENIVTTPIDLLKEFIVSQLPNNCVVVVNDKLNPQQSKMITNNVPLIGYVLVTPKLEITMRWATKERLLKISISAFRKWLQKQNRSFKLFIKSLRTDISQYGWELEQRRANKLAAGIVGTMSDLATDVFVFTGDQLDLLGISYSVDEAVSNIIPQTQKICIGNDPITDEPVYVEGTDNDLE